MSASLLGTARSGSGATSSTTRGAATRALAVLPLRLAAFAVVQAIVALTLALGGRQDAWAASVPWWPVGATAVNVLTAGVVARLLHREDRRYRDLFRLQREHVRGDLAVLAGLAVVTAVIVVVPNYLLATWLFGDPQAPLATLVQPLPRWAAWVALVAFPTTIAFSELPAYFGYAQPRLVVATARPWLAMLATATFLSLQHVTLPLVFSWDFVLWRAVMFLPFTLLLALVLHRRPRLLPYLVVLHGLADLQIAISIFGAAH